jgi:S-formylglutathione hydrolase
MLVDVGTEDQFLKDGQLEPDTLKEAAKENGREEGEVQVRLQAGYDHSYYFVSSFAWFRTDYISLRRSLLELRT